MYKTGQGKQRKIPATIIMGATFEGINVLLLFGVLMNIIMNDIGIKKGSVGNSLL